MTAGIYVRNDFGSLQIDQDYQSFALRQSGAIRMVLDNANHPQPVRVGSLTVGASLPLIAFNGGNHDVCMYWTKNNGNGTYSYGFRSTSNDDYDLRWWQFDRAQHCPTSMPNAGVQVFLGDGSKAFDAGQKPMRIVGVMGGDPQTSDYGMDTGYGWQFNRSGLIANQEIPAGRTYAAIQGTSCFHMTNTHNYWIYGSGGGGPIKEPGDGPGNRTPISRNITIMNEQSVARFSSTQASCGLKQFEIFTGDMPTDTEVFNRWYGSLMHWIVDVTGY